MQTCRVCRGQVAGVTTALLRMVEGRRVEVTDVPAERCADCGEEWFRAGDLKQIDRLLARSSGLEVIRFRRTDPEWAAGIRRKLPWLPCGEREEPATIRDLVKTVRSIARQHPLS